MDSNMKGALWACGLALPLIGGVGYFADIATRASIAAIIISHGGTHADVVAATGPIWFGMLPALVLIWAVASGIVLTMAKLGFGGHSFPKVPPPPSFLRQEDRQKPTP